MVEQKFFKKINATRMEIYKRVFDKLEPVSKISPDRFELPITSIRRVLGDDFYNLTSKKDDVLQLYIEDNCGFNIDDLKVNLEKSRDMITIIGYVFNIISQINGGNTVFSPEFAATKNIKLAVTTPNGVSTNLICLDDLKDLCTYNSQHFICGMMNIQAINDVSIKVQENDNAYKQLQVAGNVKACTELDKERSVLIDQLYKLTNEVLDTFLKTIARIAGVEDPKTIFDVQFIMSIEYIEEDPQEKDKSRSIYQTFDVCMHDAVALNVLSLERQFHLDMSDK